MVSMPTRFAILGDGAWGTAIALLLAAQPDHRVCLWSAFADNIRRLSEQRENSVFLPGVRIPPEIDLTDDVDHAVANADLIVVAVPTVYLRKTLTPIASRLPKTTPFLSVAKGVENETFLRPSAVLQQVVGVERVAVLSGPSHAEEASRGQPTSVVVASTDTDLAAWVQQRFNGERFRIYTHRDVIGVELGGALKNVIGIAAGISDGLGFGDNTKSALMTRGLAEMTRFGVALGAEATTFFGLAGIGDLITTCVSRHGRNRHVGERLGKGEKLADLLASMKMVAEGVYTARSVYQQALKLNIDMPITTEIYRVLYEGKDPKAAVTDLMLREPKGEKML
jgi:glycerol-3-phosphate dehydrogenase (NAD(P)+)